MDDCNDEHYNNGLVDSSSYIICGHNAGEINHRSHPLGRNVQAKKKVAAAMSVQVPRPQSVLKKSTGIANAALRHQATDTRLTAPIRKPPEPYCHVKLDSIIKLKDSTKKLLCLLEDIQSKTYAKDFPPPPPPPPPESCTSEIKLKQSTHDIPSETEIVVAPALKNLEEQTKTLTTIYIEDEDDDCSIFKRLTRKCNCLNQQEYNDFVIHFNEDTKYFTSTIGEIIKNMRILKKFLYMGGGYTRNALIFLNEGLADSAFAEKVEITQGCSHSDMCNVFEDHSMVITCIAWPCKIEYYGDNKTRNLAASFLYKLAQLEEGRRYLKFTSRITNDIKKILRKKGSKLDMDTVELLNSALNLMHPPMTQNNSVTYYCKLNDEGYVNESIKALTQYRQYMTLDEVFTHLDLLHNLSKEGRGKTDLTSFLPDLILLFKQMLKEYDDSEMNIIITNILNNIISKNMLKQANHEDLPKTLIMADTATEAIKMKNEISQMPTPPPKKTHTKRAGNKSKSYLGGTNKFRQASRRKVSDWENPGLVNRSKKFAKERRQIIVVPIEKK